MVRGPTAKQMTDLIFDDREILGLRGSDKIRIIVKIQSVFRGALARRKYRQRGGFLKKTINEDFGMSGSIPNYQNPKVQEIKERLGPFKYEPKPRSDGVRR